MRNKQNKGFTLVELMIIVAIIGIISAIAIPAFTKYIKRSRSAEVAGYLNKEWAGSITYYMTDFSAGSGGVLPRQFPGPSGEWETTAAGKDDCCEMSGGRCPGNAGVWASDPVWMALKFSIPDSHNYMPGYSGAAEGTNATFTAYVQGNLDCDEVVGKFARQGGINTNGDVTGSYQPVVTNELE
jgi:prepilin-type N-terminal cleavage/methylation domain-containing protein